MSKDFFSYVMPIPESGCWIWMGHSDKDGYGLIGVNRKGYRAHRYSWTIYKGEIPKGMFVLHKCDVKGCVNPEHLFLGTHQDNMLDMQKKGNRFSRAKLTESQVLEILEKLNQGITTYKLAAEYGVTRTHISEIKHGRMWRKLTNKESAKDIGCCISLC